MLSEDWNFAHIPLRLSPDAVDEDMCIDSGCGVTLADKPWLLALSPHVEVREIISPLCVKGLDSTMHDTDEHVSILMYIPASKKEIKVLCRIYREIYFVKKFESRHVDRQ